MTSLRVKHRELDRATLQLELDPDHVSISIEFGTVVIECLIDHEETAEAIEQLRGYLGAPTKAEQLTRGERTEEA